MGERPTARRSPPIPRRLALICTGLLVAALVISGTGAFLVLSASPGLTGLVPIGQWATTYTPDASDGDGANIEVPAQVLNGKVIRPGGQFSFLTAVGPIDEAHGFKMGGVILNGKLDPTGAIGGGICAASTAFFNAAARAGLRIDERHAHSFYIDGYPVGLDATVYSNDSTTLDMRWTNDTNSPIVIRSWWDGGSTRVIHVELWSSPTGRTTAFSGGLRTDIVKATDDIQYVPSLPGGRKTYREQDPVDGFSTIVRRTVVDKNGTAIHSDVWSSQYAEVDGLLEIAGPPPPLAAPTPSA